MYLILQYLFYPAWSPQSSLVSSKKSFIEMPLPSEPRLIAVLHLCVLHSAHHVWEDGNLQHGCLQRSMRCMGWTQEGCLLLLLLMDLQPSDKCWHKWLLLHLTKSWKDWLQPVSSQKLLICLCPICNSALQTSLWRKPKASKQYQAGTRVALFLPATMTYWVMISLAEQDLYWLESMEEDTSKKKTGCFKR